MLSKTDLSELSIYQLLELHAEYAIGERDCMKLAERDYRRIQRPQSTIPEMKAALVSMNGWDKQTAWARDCMDRIHAELTRRQLDARLRAQVEHSVERVAPKQHKGDPSTPLDDFTDPDYYLHQGEDDPE